MAAIPDDKVQEVRDRVDIVDLVGRYVELRRAGQNWKGRCPFHDEKTPSFNVNPARKGYKCFGCGAGGDAIRFVMEVEGKSFPEAVRKLAEIYGVSLPAGAGEGRAGAGATEKDDAYALTALATKTWADILAHGKGGEAGRAYLRTRGLDDEVVAAFRLGYAPAPAEAGWDRLARTIAEHRLPASLAEQLGLVGRSERTGALYDRFRGRLMFPIVAPGGEVVAFSGRIVPPHDIAADGVPPPKYTNSPESLLYTKSKSLFGLHAARPALAATRRAILVEGNLDVVRMHQWGFKETVAPLGTALTADQAKLLARFCDQVVMAFDGDAAGKKAAWAALPHLLAADLDVRMIELSEGEDPDSAGPTRLQAMLSDPKAALQRMMEAGASKAGRGVDARAKTLDRFLPLIALARRETQRELYAACASSLFDVPRRDVDAGIRRHLAAAAGSSGRGRDREENSKPGRAVRPEENSRHFRSTSERPVPPSAPMAPATEGAGASRRLPSLPAGQARLVMLLVDVPHLASVAEREGVLDWITDARLAPLAQATLDGARRGEHPSMPELLAIVDPAAQPQVHDAVFAGDYRDAADPLSELHALMHRCEREALLVQRDEAARRARRLEDEGFLDDARSARQEQLRINQRLDELEKPVAAAKPLPH
jgi:DNA primase